jgi:hypothetical protein
MAGQISLTEREKVERWVEVGNGIITIAEMASWIKKYFGAEEDLSKFKERNQREGLELSLRDNSRGYVFAGSLKTYHWENHEHRMEKTREEYHKRNKITDRKFVDYRESLSGFSWRAIK